MSQQTDRILSVERHRHDAHRHAHRLKMRGKLIRLHEPHHQAIEKPFEARPPRVIRQKNDKFAGADAADFGRLRQIFDQSLRENSGSAGRPGRSRSYR